MKKRKQKQNKTKKNSAFSEDQGIISRVCMVGRKFISARTNTTELQKRRAILKHTDKAQKET